jgi:hypothetical protein
MYEFFAVTLRRKEERGRQSDEPIKLSVHENLTCSSTSESIFISLLIRSIKNYSYLIYNLKTIKLTIIYIFSIINLFKIYKCVSVR